MIGSRRLLDRLVAAAVFAVALLLYGLTAAPTVSFWDTGEFIASAHGLQVNHPPGAPLYLLIGHVASTFVPDAWVAAAVNSVSVVCSALTVLLAHLIVVALVRRWRPADNAPRGYRQLTALGGGAIGALAFAATDSFWFNAVEAEVYALATFFAALVCWLALRWSARVDAEALRRSSKGGAGHGAHRYLILIAYLFGLVIGVHLIGLLAFFFVGAIVYFTVIERPAWTPHQRWTRRVVAGGVIGGIFLLIYPGIVKGLPQLAGASGAPALVLIGTLASVAGAVHFTRRRRWPRAHLATLCLAAVLIGYSTYALVFIRSATDPAIDIGNPETPEAFVAYLNRAQYGATPLFSGPTFDDRTGRVDPRDAAALFPRRYSTDPQHWRVYDRYDSDLAFFLDYQVGHMYLRYFLWNFAGRAGDVQDTPAITGISAIDPAPATGAQQTPSEAAGRNVYYALPLLLGLFGAFYHFRRDERRAWAVLVLFLVTGLGIVLYLNQPPMEPRERDYSFVVSFFAFSLWIGLGAAGMLERVGTTLRRLRVDPRAVRAIGATLTALLLLTVPAQMIQQNVDDHDRSGRYAARDFAYNMLASVAEDSILFTYGDNDTYPLWYLQNVEGIRPDVRVVNLSLLDTPWYIKQLKQRIGTSAPVPMSLSDAQIDALRYRQWEPRTVQLPVDEARLLAHQPDLKQAITATHPLEQPMRWQLQGRAYDRDLRVLAVKDQVAYNILRTNAEQGWKRPIYFAVTTGSEAHLDLAPYFQLEGLAHRVVPIRHEQPMGRVVPGLTDARFASFRLTNLDDPDVYFDATARGTLGSHYRLWPTHAAHALAEQGHVGPSRRLLDRFVTAVPFTTIPADTSLRLQVARAFLAAGASDRARTIAHESEPLVLHDLRVVTQQRGADQRQIARTLQAAGALRSVYRTAADDAALAAFDDALTPILNRLPVRLPHDVRRAFGLPALDTAS